MRRGIILTGFYTKRKSSYPQKNEHRLKWLSDKGAILTGLLILIVVAYFKFIATPKAGQFTDYFNNIDDRSLTNNGWFVKSKDEAYWSKRNKKPGQLTLYTLKGDNWPDPASTPGIKNLLLRQITSDCFTAEVHIKNFMPRQEWQQAGILLLEDTLFKR